MGVILNQVVFAKVIHFGMSVSCKHLFISISSLPRIEVNFIYQYPCNAVMSWCFPVLYFSSVALSKSRCIFASVILRVFKNFFPVLLIYSASSVTLSSLPYFAPKLFCFHAMCLLAYVRAFSPYLLVEPFRYLEIISFFFPVLFYSVSIPFYSSFFRLYLLINFLELKCLFYFLCCFFLIPTCCSVLRQSYHFCSLL